MQLLTDQFTEELLSRIKVNQLSNIDLRYQAINDNQIILLVEALKHNSSVVSIFLSMNQISNAGAQALSEVLKVNSSLTIIYLNGNQISNEGAQALSEALKVNQTLTTLNINRNQIDDTGVQAFSEALKVNSSLISLDLAANQISCVGMRALSDALTVNQTLNSLDISDNQIGDVGIQTLSKALKMNQSLTTLNLCCNRISDIGIQTLKVNRILTTLYLSGNTISAINTQAISKVLQSNKEWIKATRNYTLLILVLLLRQAHSPQSQLPVEIWQLIMNWFDFPSVKKGYRTSHAIASFFTQKNIVAEFNQRLQAQQSVRLVETHGPKMGASRFSFLIAKEKLLAEFNQAALPESNHQYDDQLLLKK